MHELSIATAIVGQVEAIFRQQGATGVRTVTVVVGTLSGVDREALEFAFPVAAETTVVAGARLIVREVQASVKCRACGAAQQLDIPLALCAACGSTDVEMTGGRDLLLQSVELEEE